MQDKEKKNLLKKPGFWLALLLVILWVIVSNMMKGAEEIVQNSPQTNSSVANSEEITEEYRVALAKTFCSERSGSYVRSIDFDDFILMYEKAGESVNLHPEMGTPSDEKCRKVSDICLEVWGKKDCERISVKNIWIGMDKDQVMLSWGLPDDTNNTVSSGGIRSQWVYGDFGPYVYLEGKSEKDLTVTSWQD